MARIGNPGSGRREVVERCASCGHRESDHGQTGLRPCLAMSGRLLHRNFCECDSFQPPATAAPAPLTAKPAA